MLFLVRKHLTVRSVDSIKYAARSETWYFNWALLSWIDRYHGADCNQGEFWLFLNILHCKDKWHLLVEFTTYQSNQNYLILGLLILIQHWKCAKLVKCGEIWQAVVTFGEKLQIKPKLLVLPMLVLIVTNFSS